MSIRTRNALIFLALGLALGGVLSAASAHARLAELERCLCLVDHRR